MPHLRRALAPVLLLASALVASSAFARPGGGHSFSSGSHSSFGGSSHSYSSSGSSYSGGYSGGRSGLFILLFDDHPWMGWSLVIACVAFSLYRRLQQSGEFDWTTISGRGGSGDTEEPPAPAVAWRDRLLRLRSIGPRPAPGQRMEPFDPDFSIVLFEDFVYALYARLQQARAGKLDELAAYVSEDTRRRLAMGHAPAAVSNVVIGAMRYVRVSDIEPASEWVSVTLEFESNYAELDGSGTERAYYAVDRLRLRRRTNVRSRPPQKARVLDCPNCGAPLSAMRGETCGNCGKQVGGGDFDWVVSGAEFLSKEERAPQLTGTVEEVGTNRPTIVAPDALSRIRALGARDSTFSWEAFTDRVRLTYAVMNDAWSSLQWDKARPFLSDNLFQMQSYWIDAYRNAGLRNVLEQMQVTGVQLAKVVSDRWFDAITVRVSAKGLDYTVRESNGSVVGGSRNRPRAYTEYWTFIRGVGVQRATTTEKKCPNCGAPLKINMAGQCEYCQAKVSSGEFDWVLSRIEQDETYAG